MVDLRHGRLTHNNREEKIICGITALSRPLEHSSIPDPRVFLKLAALAIEKRGPDATGFAWTTTSGRSWYWKTPQTARKAIRDVKLDIDITTAIGHARWATQGDVKDNANNHPVVEDGIMLVHNGVIDNDRELFRLFGDEYTPKAEVDTQVAAALLANPGIMYAEHPTDLLSLIEGSAAFAWIDTDDQNTLHLARCADRPMTLGWTRRGDLVMSSTPETLDDLSMWANIRFRNIREVDEGTYLRVVGGVIVEEKMFAVKRKAKGYKFSSGWTSPYGGQTKTKTVTKPVTKPKLTTVPELPKAYDDWYDDEGFFLDPKVELVDDEPDDWEREEEVIERILDVHPDIHRQTLWELGEEFDLAGSPWLPDGSDIDWDNLVMWGR